MSKRDNPFMVLMTHRNVNLKCDEDKIQCRYIRVEGKDWGTWWVNGEDTKLQCTELFKTLTNKYNYINVTWKRQ